MTEASGKSQLKAFVERIERLEEEKKAIADDVRDVYAEAKSHGFDTRALRVIVRKRKLDQEERLNQEQLVETYMVALGMGWGKSEEDIDIALDKRRTEAGKAKTARNGKPPPRAQACLVGQLDIEDVIWTPDRLFHAESEEPAAVSSVAGPEEAASDGVSPLADLPLPADPAADEGARLISAHEPPAFIPTGVQGSTSPAHARDNGTPSAAASGHPDRAQTAGEQRPRLGNDQPLSQGGADQASNDDMLDIPAFLRRALWSS
jgi:uncharacterized protein (UPF0335 family)